MKERTQKYREHLRKNKERKKEGNEGKEEKMKERTVTEK